MYKNPVGIILISISLIVGVSYSAPQCANGYCIDYDEPDYGSNYGGDNDFSSNEDEDHEGENNAPSISRHYEPSDNLGHDFEPDYEEDDSSYNRGYESLFVTNYESDNDDDDDGPYESQSGRHPGLFERNYEPYYNNQYESHFGGAGDYDPDEDRRYASLFDGRNYESDYDDENIHYPVSSFGRGWQSNLNMGYGSSIGRAYGRSGSGGNYNPSFSRRVRPRFDGGFQNSYRGGYLCRSGNCREMQRGPPIFAPKISPKIYIHSVKHSNFN